MLHVYTLKHTIYIEAHKLPFDTIGVTCDRKCSYYEMAKGIKLLLFTISWSSDGVLLSFGAGFEPKSCHYNSRDWIAPASKSGFD